jgi:site-specific DNA-methyltransferase (adenine-specific)
MKLYNGDCLKIMKSIKDKSIDAIITDPPYGTTNCKWDSVIDFNLMWKQLNRIIKDNGAIVLFGSEPFSSYLRMSNIKNFKYDWIWVKEQGVGQLNCKRQPLKKTEDIIVFNTKTYNPQGLRDCNIIKKAYKTNTVYNQQNDYIQKKTGYPNNLLKFNRELKNRKHPTQKPIALLEYLIKTYTNELETVLDFTMGSGTTGVACCNLNRDFIGIELNKDYFKIAEQRINDLL